MVFVVGVHTLAFGGGQVTMTMGAVTTIFHTSRELFLLLTALVLTYNYGHRELKPVKFWRRRFWLVRPGVRGVVGRSTTRPTATAAAPFPDAFVHDLLYAGARYHMYFLLVSMQIYLLFPLIRWVLRKTEGYHWWLFAAALRLPARADDRAALPRRRHGTSLWAQFLNGAGQGYYVQTLRAVRRRRRDRRLALRADCARSPGGMPRRRVRIAAVAGIGVAAGIGVYLIEIEVFGGHAGQRERGLPAGRHLRVRSPSAGRCWRRAAVERPGRARAEVRRRGLGQLVRHLPGAPARPSGAAVRGSR